MLPVREARVNMTNFHMFQYLKPLFFCQVDAACGVLPVREDVRQARLRAHLVRLFVPGAPLGGGGGGQI